MSICTLLGQVKTKLFKEATEAYNVLSNPKTREEYDLNFSDTVYGARGGFSKQAGGFGPKKPQGAYRDSGIRAPREPPSGSGGKFYNYDLWEEKHYGEEEAVKEAKEALRRMQAEEEKRRKVLQDLFGDESFPATKFATGSRKTARKQVSHFQQSVAALHARREERLRRPPGAETSTGLASACTVQ